MSALVLVNPTEPLFRSASGPSTPIDHSFIGLEIGEHFLKLQRESNEARVTVGLFCNVCDISDCV